jgi:hypothetical protein
VYRTRWRPVIDELEAEAGKSRSGELNRLAGIFLLEIRIVHDGQNGVAKDLLHRGDTVLDARTPN